jgi:heptosyltransferase-2
MWPSERYAELCNGIIKKRKAKIVFIGDENEIKLINSIHQKIENKNNTINLAGKITLNQLFYLISRCSLFIGNDAGPMHIAAAQGIETLGLFGPNLPIRFGPYGKGNIGLYKGYNCEFSPCINVHLGQVPDCLYPKKSDDYQKCMKNISVDDVLKQAEKLS